MSAIQNKINTVIEEAAKLHTLKYNKNLQQALANSARDLPGIIKEPLMNISDGIGLRRKKLAMGILDARRATSPGMEQMTPLEQQITANARMTTMNPEASFEDHPTYKKYREGTFFKVPLSREETLAKMNANPEEFKSKSTGFIERNISQPVDRFIREKYKDSEGFRARMGQSVIDKAKIAGKEVSEYGNNASKAISERGSDIGKAVSKVSSDYGQAAKTAVSKYGSKINNLVEKTTQKLKTK